jgi:cellobiose-specific phosphotransferase system component IIA
MSEPENIIKNAIAANLTALAQRLTHAAALANEAHEAMTNVNQNLAMGTVIEFERLLPEAQALYNAAVALHRNHS